MYDVQVFPGRLSVRLSASLTNIDSADETVTAFLAGAEAPLDVFAVRILLREALLNAVSHGCGEDEDRVVDLGVELETTGVKLVVEDDGPGFVWQNRDITLDILGDGGRGLPLMQSYSSEMIFNEAGNRVQLRRDFEAAIVGDDREGGGQK